MLDIPHPWLIALAMGATLSIAAWAAWVDLRSRRIPNLAVLGAAIPTALVVVWSPSHAAGVLAAALVAGGPLMAVHLISPTAMGFGDVKLAAVLGASLGLIDWRLGLVAICVASGATAVVGLVVRRGVLPFAPGLWFGTVATIIFVVTFGGTFLS